MPDSHHTRNGRGNGDTPRQTSKGQPFALEVGKLLLACGASTRLGPAACWLITVVALEEDRLHYPEAVDFWNPQLAQFCGFSSEETLSHHRKTAVEAGWLMYEKGAKGRAGIYKVIIPPDVPRSLRRNLPATTRHDSTDDSPQKIGRKRGQSTGEYAEHPDPDPKPKPKPLNGSANGASGAGAQRAKKGRKIPSVFADFPSNVLRDIGRLLDWQQDASKQPEPVISFSEHDRLRTIAAALHALAPRNPPIRDPARMFASIFIGTRRNPGPRWHLITDDEMDRARERLADYEASKRGPPLDVGLVDFGGIPHEPSTLERQQTLSRELDRITASAG